MSLRVNASSTNKLCALPAILPKSFASTKKWQCADRLLFRSIKATCSGNLQALQHVRRCRRKETQGCGVLNPRICNVRVNMIHFLCMRAGAWIVHVRVLHAAVCLVTHQHQISCPSNMHRNASDRRSTLRQSIQVASASSAHTACNAIASG